MIQQRDEEETQDWETVSEDLRQLGEKLLGKTSGNMKQVLVVERGCSGKYPNKETGQDNP